MLFKDISYLELWQPAEPFLKFGAGHHDSRGTTLLNYFKFVPVVQVEKLFEDISYLELWPLYPAKWNHLCNFSRSHHEEQFCEIILILDKWFRRKCKDISYLELWRSFCLAE